MKTLIAAAFMASGLFLGSCDDAETIAPNDMTSGSASKQTLDTDSTGGVTGQGTTVTNTGTGSGTGNGGGSGNGNGNGNGGLGTGFTGP